MSFSRAARGKRCLEPIFFIDLNNPHDDGIGRLRTLLSTENPKCKLVCISIAGRCRSGKNHLLSLFIRYLEARCGTKQRNHDRMEHTGDEELEALLSSHGMQGILIWPKLFKIDENTAVLLMDTQGLFDDTATLQKDAKLICLSLLLSSVQIFSVIGDLDMDCIENLDRVTEVARPMSDSPRPFQELIILIRGWRCPQEFDYGWTGGQNRLNLSRDGASQSTWARITACFENDIQCFLMPGFNCGDKTKSKKIAGMKGVFIDKVKEFIEEIFRPPNLKRVKFNGEEITCEEFAEITERFFGKEGRNVVGYMISSAVSDQINKLVVTLEEEHCDTISQLSEKGPFAPASLKTYLRNELEEILKKFDSRKIDVAEITERGRQTLAAAIKRQNETFKTTNAAAHSKLVKTDVANGIVICAIKGALGGAIVGAMLGGPSGCVAGVVLATACGTSLGATVGTAGGAALGYLCSRITLARKRLNKKR